MSRQGMSSLAVLSAGFRLKRKNDRAMLALRSYVQVSGLECFRVLSHLATSTATEALLPVDTLLGH